MLMGAILCFFLAVLIFASAAVSIRKGSIDFKRGNVISQGPRRSENPIGFWSLLIAFCSFGLLCLCVGLSRIYSYLS